MDVDTKDVEVVSQKSPPRKDPPQIGGFGKQLESFTGPDSITEQKEPIEKADFEIYDVNLEDSAGTAGRSGKPPSTAIYKGKPQNFTELRDENLRNGTLFEDPEFPAAITSMQISSIPKDKQSTFDEIKWLRPKEIVKTPKLFVSGFSRFDVKQGALGNCWAVAGMAALAQRPQLFKKVVNDDDQGFGQNYAGIFHFRFWEYDKWADIVIDDRLPVYNGSLYYARSTEENEFWIALVEKAYAKFYGSYEALIDGYPQEAMQDFTGGTVETFMIVDMKNRYQNVFKTLLKAFERGSLISASIANSPVKGRDTLLMSLGLIPGHAYSITNVRYIPTSKATEEIPLLRVRNPWGDELEWNGPWSDNSEEWNDVSENVKKQIGLTFDHDGEFWINWDNFETYFTLVDFCHLTFDSLSKEQISSGFKKKWEVSTIKGTWVRGISPIGLLTNYTSWRNPQYRITLTSSDKNDKSSKCTLIVSLMQKHRRGLIPMGDNYLFIGFQIYYLRNPESTSKPLRAPFFIFNKPVGSSPNAINIAIMTYRFDFPPGTYCIIPYTVRTNEEGSFMLRIVSETKNNMEVYDEEVGVGEIAESIIKTTARMGTIDRPAVDEHTQQMFLKLSDASLEVHWLELKQLLDASTKDETKNKGFSEDACRSILALSDEDNSGTLDYQEFKKLWIDLAKWRAAFKALDKENSGILDGFEIREALSATGFRINNLILIDMVHRYGNAERKLNFEAYILCAVKIKAMIELYNSKVSDKSNTAKFSLQELLHCAFCN